MISMRQGASRHSLAAYRVYGADREPQSSVDLRMVIGVSPKCCVGMVVYT